MKRQGCEREVTLGKVHFKMRDCGKDNRKRRSPFKMEDPSVKRKWGDRTIWVDGQPSKKTTK
jgi:hypothetical protein